MRTPKPCYAFPCIGNSYLIMPQALPEDLKTKLSLDEDLVSSPKEALSRASADRVAMRNKHLKRCTFQILLYGCSYCELNNKKFDSDQYGDLPICELYINIYHCF